MENKVLVAKVKYLNYLLDNDKIKEEEKRLVSLNICEVTIELFQHRNCITVDT